MNVETGRRGEDLAAAFLLAKGMLILHRNWRVRSGEIDIIARDRDTIVFCEVKSRSSNVFGHGAEAVTRRKQQKIIQSAQIFLQWFHCSDKACRFDVVEVLLIENKEPAISYYANAFYA